MINKLLFLLVLTSSCSAMQIKMTYINRLAELRVKASKETEPIAKVKIEQEIKRFEYLVKVFAHGNSQIYYPSRDHMLHEEIE